MKYSKIGQEYV